jgi:hypothetical protein
MFVTFDRAYDIVWLKQEIETPLSENRTLKTQGCGTQNSSRRLRLRHPSY